MKALVGAFNQEKALVGAFSVIVQPVVEPMEHYTALVLGSWELTHHAVGVVDAERRGHDEDRGELPLHLHLHHRHVLVHRVLRHAHTPVLEEPGRADAG